MIHAKLYGHWTYYDASIEEWRYEDTDAVVDGTRGCPQCGKPPTPEGHDACLGHIDGVLYACCGHGIEPGYILWEQPTEAQISREYRIGNFGFTFSRFVPVDKVSRAAPEIKPFKRDALP